MRIQLNHIFGLRMYIGSQANLNKLLIISKNLLKFLKKYKEKVIGLDNHQYIVIVLMYIVFRDNWKVF